jgi:hypothetical protein
MKNPQSLAIEIKDTIKPEHLESIGRYGCCAFVLLWCLGIEPDDIEAIKTVNSMISAKVIEDDCTVKWADAVYYLTGRKITVEFKDIKDLRGIRERTPVRYDYKGKGHWVGVENGMIKFNPLIYSQCVDKGRPVTARIIRLAK